MNNSHSLSVAATTVQSRMNRVSIKEWLRTEHPLLFALLHRLNCARNHVLRALFVIGHLPRLWRLRVVVRRMRQQWGHVVISGPFAGTRYQGEACGSVAPPKLLGSYEEELHGVMSKLIAGSHEHIIDIGAAEGYYAVGLARLRPDAQVTAFELCENARRQCRRLARDNDVSNLDIRGRCSTQVLGSLTTRPAFVLSDCEGAEIDLLDPTQVPGLHHCELLVELHEHLVPDEARRLLDRFVTSHRWALIPATTRVGHKYPQLEFLSSKFRDLAVNEFRTRGQQWLHLVPRVLG